MNAVIHDMRSTAKDRRVDRGKRLTILRKMLCSRKDFAERYNISPGTLQNWERSRFGGLTENGADKIIEIFRQEGIHVSYEWVWLGIGKGPVFPQKQDAPKNAVTKKDKNRKSYHQELQDEINKLHSIYANLVHMTVDTTRMLPNFLPGDTIAGVKSYGKHIKFLNGKNCIIEDEKHDLRVAMIRNSNFDDRFHIIQTNVDGAQHIEPNIKILSAAQIFWTRRECF